MTVASDSAYNNPADSTVWSSSTNNPSASTFTLRIWRSMGSGQCFFSWSIAFNSSIVFVGMASTVRTPPSKVFTFTSQGMAAMATRKPYFHAIFESWGVRLLNVRWLKLHCFPTKVQNVCKTVILEGSLTLKHNHLERGRPFWMQLLPKLKERAFCGETSPLYWNPTRNVGLMLACLVAMACPWSFLECFWPQKASRAEK